MGFRSSKLYTIRPNLYASPAPLLPPSALTTTIINNTNSDKQNNAPAAGTHSLAWPSGTQRTRVALPKSRPLTCQYTVF